MNFQHIRLIGVYGIRFALRTGGGLVFLLLILFTGLSVAATFISPVEAILANPDFAKSGRSPDELARDLLENEEVRDVIQGAVEFFTDADTEQSAYLVRGQPALLSTTFILLLFLIPFLTCFGAFNQTAGEIGSRGLRYLLLRTDRGNIYFGRFLGTALFAAATTGMLVALIAVYVQFKLRVYSGGAIWLWSAQGLLAVYVLSLAYMAMCSLFSALLDSAFGSLAICLLAAIFPPVFLLVTSKMLIARGLGADWLPRLLPWGWKYDLLSQDPGTRLLAFGVVLAFAAAFLGVGFHFFRKRDL